METNSKKFECHLLRQGFPKGACLVKSGTKSSPACKVTLKKEYGGISRLIHAVHLSRPENYLSIYQSGCNLSCRKCHSSSFSQFAEGFWLSSQDITGQCKEYETSVNLIEPRERATAWHAHESCLCCGSCVTKGARSIRCPGTVEASHIILSPQGWGPARNIVGFTGGDLTCCPDFYAECARLIKEQCSLWVLIETNGFGLTPKNLDLLQESGVDAFWLDIKAFDSKIHRWLTGADNGEILRLPEEILRRGFTLEVLSLYIPGLVESEEMGKIAALLSGVDPEIPFTLLAFFPEYKMKSYRAPYVEEVVKAYENVIDKGLRQVRIGNLGVFIRSHKDLEYLSSHIKEDAF